MLEKVVRIGKFWGGERAKLVDSQEKGDHRVSSSFPFFDYSLKLCPPPIRGNLFIQLKVVIHSLVFREPPHIQGRACSTFSQIAEDLKQAVLYFQLALKRFLRNKNIKRHVGRYKAPKKQRLNFWLLCESFSFLKSTFCDELLKALRVHLWTSTILVNSFYWRIERKVSVQNGSASSPILFSFVSSTVILGYVLWKI